MQLNVWNDLVKAKRRWTEKKLFHQHESKVRRPSVEDVFCRHQQGDYPFRQEFNNSQLEVREYFPHGFKGNFLLG
jgi:hypothetical protein